MNTSGFPNCCGAVVHTNFGHTTSNAAELFQQPSRPDAAKITAYLLDQHRCYGSKAFQLVILNEDQYKAVGPAFEQNGYSVVSMSYYYGHKQTLRLLVKTSSETPEG